MGNDHKALKLMAELAEVFRVVVLAGAAAAALLVIGKFLRGVYRFFQRMEAIHDAVVGELLPNGGTSIKDQIGDLVHRVTALEDGSARDRPQL